MPIFDAFIRSSELLIEEIAVGIVTVSGNVMLEMEEKRFDSGVAHIIRSIPPESHGS
jgi:hypothetical protein